MPLGSFGNVPDRNASSEELADAFSRLLKEVTYLLNGGLDTLNVNELNADVINAGVLNALLVVIKAAYSGGASITIDLNGIKINDGTKDTFKADTAGKVTMTGATVKNNLNGTAYTQIDDTGIKINDGTKNTFTADITGLVTMIGALIQSAAGYPRIELNSVNNLFAAYASATTDVKIVTSTAATGSTPALLFEDGTNNAFVYLSAAILLIATAVGNGTDIQINSGKDLYLDGTNIKISGWSKLLNTVSSRTLQQDLDAKAIGSGINGTVYVSATSGGPATMPITFTNGVRTV